MIAMGEVSSWENPVETKKQTDAGTGKLEQLNEMWIDVRTLDVDGGWPNKRQDPSMRIASVFSFPSLCSFMRFTVHFFRSVSQFVAECWLDMFCCLVKGWNTRVQTNFFSSVSSTVGIYWETPFFWIVVSHFNIKTVGYNKYDSTFWPSVHTCRLRWAPHPHKWCMHYIARPCRILFLFLLKIILGIP